MYPTSCQPLWIVDVQDIPASKRNLSDSGQLPHNLHIPFPNLFKLQTYISLPEYSQSRKTKMHPPPHSLWVIWPSLKPSPSSSSFARTQLTLFCSTLFLAKAKALRLSTSIAYNWTFNSLSTGTRIIIPLCQYTKFESKARCELDQLLESQSHLQMVHTKRERSDPKVYSANSTCKSRREVETRTQEQRFHLSEGKKDTLKRQMYPANTLKEQ
jgi:hypothetical protein